MKKAILFIYVLIESFGCSKAFAVPPQLRGSRALHLVNGGLRTEVTSETISMDESGIPHELVAELENRPILPFQFKYVDSSGVKTIQIRQLEKETLSDAVSLCLKEYGTYASNIPQNATPLDKLIQERMNDFDNFFFSFIVLLGLGQRVERREKSDADAKLPQDHNVICISEIDSDQNERIFGMAEVSLQPPDPSRTSPPFVIPFPLKNILSSVYGAEVFPYISNVLITNEYRGKRFSKVLMAACEGLAKSWGYDRAYLHVDADSSSGGPAQNLYRTLGYEPVIDEKYNEKFTWMGIDAVNRGLYIVDGVALLFLKKKLNLPSNVEE